MRNCKQHRTLRVYKKESFHSNESDTTTILYPITVSYNEQAS